MKKERHIFKVWHPSKGGVPVYNEQEFVFNEPVSRTYAREIVEKIEGYVIQKERVVEKRIRQRSVRNPKQKIR